MWDKCMITYYKKKSSCCAILCKLLFFLFLGQSTTFLFPFLSNWVLAVEFPELSVVIWIAQKLSSDFELAKTSITCLITYFWQLHLPEHLYEAGRSHPYIKCHCCVLGVFFFSFGVEKELQTQGLWDIAPWYVLTFIRTAALFLLAELLYHWAYTRKVSTKHVFCSRFL